jgi:hypothetical protein
MEEEIQTGYVQTNGMSLQSERKSWQGLMGVI